MRGRDSWTLRRPGRATVAAALLLACAALGAPAPDAVAIAPPRDCSVLTVGGQRYIVKADQVPCAAARTLARRYLAGGRRPRGYRCRDFGRETRLRFRCSRGIRVVFAIRR